VGAGMMKQNNHGGEKSNDKEEKGM
jgi:hypothetical protein